MNEPTPQVQRRLTLIAFETALRVQAANGNLPAPEVGWLLARLSLNAPQTAVRLRRVLQALDPEVRSAVRRLAAASDTPGDTRLASRAIQATRSEESRPERLLRTPEAAALLGVQPQSVRIAIRRGALPAVKDSDGEWVVSSGEVERYRVSRKAGAR